MAWNLRRAAEDGLLGHRSMRTGPSAWKLSTPLWAALAPKAAPVVDAAAATPLARKRKAILVDGNNALYHFFNPLCTIKRINGDKSGAIEGVVRLLKRLDDLHQPQHICVFFDQPQQKTARKLLDPTYKSNRRPTPQTLRPQLTSAPSLLKNASINCMTCTGIEADDMIASYTSALFTSGYDVLIVSNDNDFLQLARGERRTKDAKEADPGPTAPARDSETAPDAAAPYVEIYQMNKRRYLRERHIRSRFNVPPWQLPDFFALCGISWGKLPRVEGVTDEIAVELLTKYGSLPRLLRSLDEIEDPVLRKTLKHSIGHIESAYRISKLVDHYALPSAIEELVVPRFDGFPKVCLP